MGKSMMFSSMKKYFLLNLVFSISFCCYAYDNNVIVGWNDFIITNGPGTDGAFDSPEGIERVMERWKGRGFTGVYWRVDQSLEGDPSLVYTYDTGIHPGTAEIMFVIRDAVAQFPVSQTAMQKAEAQGLTFWAWCPIVYSRGAPVSGTGIWFPWGHQDSYMVNHPEAILTDRTGTKKRWMLSEFGYTEARTSKIAEFEYYANQFGFKNFIACLRTEDGQNQDFPNDADEFGFNQIIVDQMQAVYGVNILTDPRFDVLSTTFNRSDPMVENWRVLRGNYLTEFYRELRQSMNTIDPNIKISVQIPGGDYVGPSIGNIKLDWRKWINEGLVNELVIPIQLEGTVDVNSNAKGYLTNAYYGVGVYPVSTFRSFINASPNPNIKLIYGGGPYFNFTTPPAGTDGWRTDGSTDLYYLGWYQRWQQWKADIQEFGYIKYIEQDFDGFTVNSKGMSGGLGESRYNPTKRKCEGLWYEFGDGSDNKPVIQNDVYNGLSGNAVKITRDSDGVSGILLGRHYGRPDRSKMFYTVDNSIFNGKCTYEFSLYRKDSASALSAYLQYDVVYNYNVGIFIGSGVEGTVSFANNGALVATSKKLGVGTWQKFIIEVNLENSTYSVFMGAEKESSICRDVPYLMASNTFNQIYFNPQGSHGTVMYLDDVSLKWYPAKLFGDDGITQFLVDSFDSHAVDSSIHNSLPGKGSALWTVSPQTFNSSYFIENDLSFGNGFKCLAVKKSIVTSAVNSGAASTIPLNVNSVVSAQWDMWLSPDGGSSVALKKVGTSSTIAAVKAESGKWYYYENGSYVESGQNYDTTNKIWYHVQIWLDGSGKTYKIVLQPLGEKPIVIADNISWNSNAENSDTAFFEISPLGNTNTITYFDNIEVTYGAPDLCGGSGNIKPLADLNNDCSVDFMDIAIIARHWLESGYWR